MTLAGTIMGTPQYMSPEQARGEVEDLDNRSDLYALGAILYHILALRPPVTGRNAMEVVSKVADGHVEPLVGTPRRGVRGERSEAGEATEGRRGAPSLPHLPGGSIPDSLAAVARKAMAFERDQRYWSVEELQADLTAYQTGFATRAENAGLGKQLLLALKRHKAVATSIAAALVILAAVVSAAFFRITNEKNRATVERDRAARALADLQRTAPTLIAAGRKLIDAQQFDDALAKISFAVTIEPKNVEYRLLRAQLLQAMLRLDEAAAEFRRVLALGPNDSAQANLALCEKLLRDYPNAAAFDRAAWQSLYAQMDQEGRATQAAPIAIKLGLAKNAAEALLNARLVEWRKIPGWEKRQETDRIKWNRDGTLNVNFADVLISDLSSMQGLPVSELIIDNTQITDLETLRGLRLRSFETTKLPKLTDISPLKGMPLESFKCETGTFSDLSPLAGMPLKRLRVTSPNLRDFSVIKGMPLQELFIATIRMPSLNAFSGLPISHLIVRMNPDLSDISAVRTMRLHVGDFSDCPKLQDFTPLLDCPDLEIASLPTDRQSIEVLRHHPRLKTLGYFNRQQKPAAEFWAEFDAIWKAKADDAAVMAKLRAAFATAGLPEVAAKNMSRNNDGTYSISFDSLGAKMTRIPNLHDLPMGQISLAGCAVTDLSPLAGLPIRVLLLQGSRAVDFAPLRECPQLTRLSIGDHSGRRSLLTLKGLKLDYLHIGHTSIDDLTPLKGMPLHELYMSYTSVSDLSPLADLPLVVLVCDNTKVTDLRPLVSCTDLESLVIPDKATNVGELRALKNLKRLSYKWDNAFGGPAQSAEEFWKEYDAQHPAEKK